MTESVLDVDSAVDAGTPDEGASSDTGSDVVFFPDSETDATQDAAPEAETGHSTPAENSATNGNVDLLRTPVDQLPENLQPLAPLAKNLQADYTRVQQDLRERESQLAAREQQIQTQNQQAQQYQQQWADRVQQTVAPTVDPIQQMRSGLSDDENRAIDTVQAIVQHQVGSELHAMRSQLQHLHQENEGLRNAHSGVQNFVSEQVQSRTRSAVQEAIDKHGDDVRRYGPQILHMLKGDAPPNMATGKPYTVTEAYEQLAGVTQQQADALRQADQQTRRSSKRAVASNASVDSSEDGGPLSEAEVLNKLRGLGFE